MFYHRLNDHTELRLLQAQHSAALFALVEANRHHLRPWLPWVDKTQSMEDTYHFIRAGLRRFAENGGFEAGLWVEGTLAGVIGMHDIRWAHHSSAIGYWLAKGFTGQGLMTRAAAAVTHYALTDLALNRMEIRCATTNAKSCAIPERLGYKYEGTLRQAEWLEDRYFADVRVYGMLRETWKWPLKPVG